MPTWVLLGFRFEEQRGSGLLGEQARGTNDEILRASSRMLIIIIG